MNSARPHVPMCFSYGAPHMGSGKVIVPHSLLDWEAPCTHFNMKKYIRAQVHVVVYACAHNSKAADSTWGMGPDKNKSDGYTSNSGPVCRQSQGEKP